ncbi:MAG: pseudouridine synthase, partial [Gammaproteobacteria bacterium]|nr:pseudouridine synthase [Gammaproteobacteria bacterium]
MDQAQTGEVMEAAVPGELAGERPDRVAAQVFAEHSRALLSRWIKSGALVVDGEAVKPNRKLNAGQRLTLTPEATTGEDWATPQPVDFNVLHEDDQLLVIDKPAGLVAHPGAGNPDGTLVNGLLHHRAGQIDLPRAGLVHRLDQDTSGLLVVAATRQAQRRLADAVPRPQLVRRYPGVAAGGMTGG